jgi:hypothetical protein
MSDFVPAGYDTLHAWIDGEVRRRGFDPKAKPTKFWEAFDDLANYLGNHDSDERELAIIITDGGHSHWVPLHVWRQPKQKRDLLAKSSRAHWASDVFVHRDGKVYIRANLRLKAGAIEGDAARVEQEQSFALSPRVSEKPDLEQEATVVLRHMLAGLRPGDAPPKRAELQKLVMDKVDGLSERGFDRAFDVPEFADLHRPAGGSDKTIRAKKRRDG